MTQQADRTVTPVVGEWYFDDTGRVLEVTDVNPRSPRGRDVIGLLSHTPRNGHAPQDYSTDLRTFAAIWRSA
jgi:hypothetical protein